MEAPVTTTKWINVRYYHQRASFIAAVSGGALAYAALPGLLIPLISENHPQYGLANIIAVIGAGPVIGLIVAALVSLVAHGLLKMLSPASRDWSTVFRCIAWGFSPIVITQVVLYGWSEIAQMPTVQDGHYLSYALPIVTLVLCLFVTMRNLVAIAGTDIIGSVVTSLVSYLLLAGCWFGSVVYLTSLDGAINYVRLLVM